MITRFSLVIAGFAFASAAGAQAPAKAPKQVTKAEFQQNVDSRFAAVDTNKDGLLTREEIAAAQAKALEQARAVESRRLEAKFKKLDTNKDNQLSLAEFKASEPAIRTSETADQMLAQLDTNKDGKINAAEYRAKPMANFAKADANHDGILTAQEIAATRRK